MVEDMHNIPPATMAFAWCHELSSHNMYNPVIYIMMYTAGKNFLACILVILLYGIYLSILYTKYLEGSQ